MRNREETISEVSQASAYERITKGDSNPFVDYEIIGQNFPAVRCNLQHGQSMKCEGGSMAWMDDEIEMTTEGGGGLGKAFGRMIAGESIFFNHYKCQGNEGEVVFSSTFPGKIIPVDLSGGKTIIAQRSSFLASTEGVDVEMHFKKSIGKGLFGGLGFVMQKFSGDGLVFIEMGGDVEVYDLAPGEVKLIDAPHLAMMEGTCKMDIQKIGGLKNVALGGEGLFNTRIEGPGKVWLQTMPIGSLAMLLYKYMPTSSN